MSQTRTRRYYPDFTTPWRFWEGAGVMALSATILVALSWAHMAIVRQTVGMEAYLGDGERLPASVLLMGQLNKAVALLGALWLAGLAAKRLDWRAVGLRPVHAGWIVLAVIAALLLFALRLGLAMAFARLLPGWAGMMNAPFAFDAATSLIGAAGFLVMTILITPFAEEVFFRGFVFKWMSGHHPVWLAATVSSALFGISHIVPPQVVSAFLMGLFLCWLYRRTGSIWPAVTAHVVNNGVGVFLGAAAAQGVLPAALTP